MAATQTQPGYMYPTRVLGQSWTPTWESTLGGQRSQTLPDHLPIHPYPSQSTRGRLNCIYFVNKYRRQSHALYCQKIPGTFRVFSTALSCDTWFCFLYTLQTKAKTTIKTVIPAIFFLSVYLTFLSLFCPVCLFCSVLFCSVLFCFVLSCFSNHLSILKVFGLSCG